MAIITINDKAYELDSLSDDVKAQLHMLQQTDAEIARLNVQLAIAQTARVAYGKAVDERLPKEESDTIKFN